MRNFREVSSNQLRNDESRYPNLVSIPLSVETGRMGYKELTLVTDVISNLSEEGMDRIEFDFDNFLEAVTAKAYQADTTWQQTLKYFEFLPEKHNIEKFLGIEVSRPVSEKLLEGERDPHVNGTNETSMMSALQQVSEEHKREIKAALQVNQC